MPTFFFFTAICLLVTASILLETDASPKPNKKREKGPSSSGNAESTRVPKADYSAGGIKHLLPAMSACTLSWPTDNADVLFLVGDKKELLPAHKAILAEASDVFERMFRFDEANAKATAAAAAGTGFSEEVKPVEVTDVEVGTFKAMLAFIYADDLSRLNGDNAISVLYAADKYNLPKLVKACLNFPIPELLRWADEKCRQNGKEPSAENGREMFGPAPFIKFEIKTQNICTIFNMPKFDR
ncbi:BTB/POZ domain-containing protein 3 [Globodera pallida]|nr:BTB/POZ domain-containing protein 3 [Globodera pallida]